MTDQAAPHGRPPEAVNPGTIKPGESMAARLAAGSGLPATDLRGLKVSDLPQKVPHVMDPARLFFRQVCGKVVRTDPATGSDYPVPFATVQVEDTD